VKDGEGEGSSKLCLPFKPNKCHYLWYIPILIFIHFVSFSV